MAGKEVVDLATLGIATLFDTSDILFHLQTLDPYIHRALLEDLPTPEERTRSAVLKWLHQQYPAAYETLEGTERAWCQAWEIAALQRESLYKMYNFTKRTSEENFSLQRELDKQSDAVYLESFELANKENWYTRKEPWSDSFSVDELAGLPAKNFRGPMTFLTDRNKWRTLYHCTGQWGMNELAEIVRREGFEAVCARVKAIKADFEMLRYKVITTEPFETTAKKRRKK